MDFMNSSSRKKTVQQHGGVVYPDGSALARPFDPPKYVQVGIGIAAAVALVIGIYYASGVIDSILHGAEREAAQIETNIAREVALDAPALQNYIALDDATIAAVFTEAGFQMYNMASEGSTELDLFKLPSDCTLSDASTSLALKNGISSMNAVQASKYLVGAWRFSTDRSNGTIMRLRYFDLSSTGAADSITRAMANEGWVDGQNVTVTADGTDDAGNTYREGTMQTDAGTASWRVSVCPLEDVYGISGLPSNAQYVGIRMSI